MSPLYNNASSKLVSLTKNRPAKSWVMDWLVIKTSKGTVLSFVQLAILIISSTERPARTAADDAAPRVEWALKMLESVPAEDIKSFIKCARVAAWTDQCMWFY